MDPEVTRPAPAPADPAPHSQTLDRGIRVLEALAQAEQPLSTAQLAAALGVHRSIVYRILRTLEDHRLVTRNRDGRFEPGVGLSALARSVSRTLQSAALPELAAVANEVGMTCFLVVPDGEDCVTLASVEPRHSVVSVARRPGTRHPLDRGAPGIALLAGQPPRPHEAPRVARAREAGYATSRGEVIPGLASIAVPLPGQGNHHPHAAIAVVFVGSDLHTDTADREAAIAARLRQAARAIAAELP
jgi:DNA-binding IclR family transcriptional regulator